MRFEELLERWQRGRLSHDEAAAALGVSERTLRRWRQRYEEDGADGLVDRRVGQPSPKRAPEDELERMRALYQQNYQGFTIKHFHEKLEQRHGYKLGYTTTRLYLQKTGTVSPAPRRGAHRRKRPRRPMRGMMLHQDGSKHVWLAGQPALDLIITMDDATSELYSAFLVDEEGTIEQLPRAGRGDRAPRPVHGALHRPRQPLLLHPRGRRQGLQDPADPGRPGAQAARYRPHPGVLARGQGPVRARLPDPAGPACPRSWRWPGSPPSRPPTGSSARSTCPSTTAASPSPPRSRPRSSSRCPEALWRDVLCVQEERRVGNDNCVALARPQPADPADAAAPPPGAGDRPGPRVSRRHRRHLQGTAAAGELPAGRACARRGPGRVTTATRPALWTWWTTLRVAHNPTGPTTAVNSCATYCGQNNALATRCA